MGMVEPVCAELRVLADLFTMIKITKNIMMLHLIFDIQMGIMTFETCVFWFPQFLQLFTEGWWSISTSCIPSLPTSVWESHLLHAHWVESAWTQNISNLSCHAFLFESDTRTACNTYFPSHVSPWARAPSLRPNRTTSRTSGTPSIQLGVAWWTHWFEGLPRLGQGFGFVFKCGTTRKQNSLEWGFQTLLKPPFSDSGIFKKKT